MRRMYPDRIFLFVVAVAFLACAFAQTAFAAGKTYKVTFSTGTKATFGPETTATVNAGEDFVFAITCQPPTDIKKITASNGTLTAEKTTAGGPSKPQGTINGLWTLSDITGDTTITLDLNTQEGADLPKIITGKKEAEAAISSSGGQGGPGGGGGAPPSGGPPQGGMPGGTGGGAPPSGGSPQGGMPGGTGGTPPGGAAGGTSSN